MSLKDVTTVSLCITLALPVSPALGHGDAEWIQNNPSYKQYDAPGTHCCGPEHCGVAEPGIFEELPGGFIRHKRSGRVYNRRNGSGVYHSIDGKWWYCWYLTSDEQSPEPWKYPTCIFPPFQGF